MVKIPRYTSMDITPKQMESKGLESRAQTEAFLDPRALELGTEAQNYQKLSQAISKTGEVLANGLMQIQDRNDRTAVQEQYYEFIEGYNNWLNNEKLKPEYNSIDGIEKLGKLSKEKFNEMKGSSLDKLNNTRRKRDFDLKSREFEASTFTSLSGFQAERANKISIKVNEAVIDRAKERLVDTFSNDAIRAQDINDIETAYINMLGDDRVNPKIEGGVSLVSEYTKAAVSEAAGAYVTKAIVSGTLDEAQDRYAISKAYFDKSTDIKISKALYDKEINWNSSNIAAAVFERHNLDTRRGFADIMKIGNPEVRDKALSTYNSYVDNFIKSKKIQDVNPVRYQGLINASSMDEFNNNLIVSSLPDEQKENMRKAFEKKSKGELITDEGVFYALQTHLLANPLAVDLFNHAHELSQKDFEFLNDMQQKALTEDLKKIGDIPKSFFDEAYTALNNGRVFAEDAKSGDSRRTDANMKMSVIAKDLQQWWNINRPRYANDTEAIQEYKLKNMNKLRENPMFKTASSGIFRTYDTLGYEFKKTLNDMGIKNDDLEALYFDVYKKLPESKFALETFISYKIYPAMKEAVFGREYLEKEDAKRALRSFLIK